MSRFLLILFSLFLLVIASCDDGDVIDFEFDFNDTFNACGTTDLLLFKTRIDPSETISLSIPNFELENDIFDITPDSSEILISIPVTFTYRTYDRPDLPDNIFCNNIPPSNLNIAIDQSSEATGLITRTLIEDDNDGIPAIFEGQDPNGDGDFSDALDFDGDGIPDYLDVDDDGDNILTINENEASNRDDNFIMSNAQDFDEDGMPDYLDTDDDNDGVLTRDEETMTQNQDPGDDFTGGTGRPDYLDSLQVGAVPATAFRPHTIQRTYNVDVFVRDINIDFISQDIFDFGRLVGQNTLTTGSVMVTPDFVEAP
jgi:hypothetical protein